MKQLQRFLGRSYKCFNAFIRILICLEIINRNDINLNNLPQKIVIKILNKIKNNFFMMI